MRTSYFLLILIMSLFINNQILNCQLTKFQKWQTPGYFRDFTMTVWDNNEMREVNQTDFDRLKAIGATLVSIQTQGSMNVAPPY